jgi:N-acetyl-gamma-glutamyl-phosphate reductase
MHFSWSDVSEIGIGEKMTRVGVIGATGYAGAELVRILSGHPHAKIGILTSRQYAGVGFSDIYPSMAGVVDTTCEDYSLDAVCDLADIVFLALPHKLPMSLAPDLLKKGKRVIDLSADFRFKNTDTYEAFYQPHTAGDLLSDAVYGLSEIYGDRIREADLIGNPGCYPTSVLLPLIPLIRSRSIDPNSIIADSKSGVSGAGRSLTLASHFCEVSESFKAYKVGSHRHTPEMEEILTHEVGSDVRISFTPHLVPMVRGMLTTLYTRTEKGIQTSDLLGVLSSFYKGHPFVRICPEGRFPDSAHVRGSNYCDIGVHLDEKTHRLVLISAIDNLVKGAAGQAVQNMNIMLGLPETTGLDDCPWPV